MIKTFLQKRKIFFLILISVFLLVIIIQQPVMAEFPKIENSLGPGEEVDDDLFLQGSEVKVAGHVHGVLFAVGEDILIESGAIIDNDVYLFGKSISIEDNVEIEGNLFIAGQNVNLQTDIQRNLAVSAATLEIGTTVNVGRNLFFAGFHLNQSSGSQIQDNLYAACYQISINGQIEKNFRVSAVAVQLNGEVNRNAEVSIDASGDDEGIRIWLPYMQQFNIPDLMPTGLLVGDQAKIGGQLIYTSAKSLEENLKNLPIGGVVENILDSEPQQGKGSDNVVLENPFLLRVFRLVRQLIGLLFFAILGWKFGRRYIKEASQTAISKPLNSLGVGFVCTLVVYLGGLIFSILLIILVLLLRVFTLNHLSSLLFFLGVAGIILVFTLFGILLVYVSKFILAYWIGNRILFKTQFFKENKDAWSLINGILVLLLLDAIPVFGWIFGVLVSLIGVGAIWFTLQSHDKAGILPDFE